MKVPSRKSVWSFLILFLLILGTRAASAQNLKPEEILAKHIEAIGAKERIDSVKNRLAVGLSEFESKLPSRKADGKAVIASESGNLMFLASFRSQEYPFEKIGFFSNKINLPWVTSGTRSPLGAFIADHEKILSSGLFTGTISSRWPLLDPQNKKGRVQSGGTKKVDGRKVYVLDYFPKGGGSTEFTIKVFFDSETFRHVRTEYRRQISSKQDTFGQLGRQADVKLTMTEEFGDYKTVDGLTLPYSYRINYLTNSNSGVYEYIWGINITQYHFNQKLDSNFFTFDTK